MSHSSEEFVDEDLSEEEDEEEEDYNEDDHEMYGNGMDTHSVQRQDKPTETRPLATFQQGLNLSLYSQPTHSYCLPPKQEAMCMSVSGDSNVLAVGCRNGSVMTFNPSTLGVLQEITVETDQSREACTAIKFRPDLASSSTKNVVLVAKGDKLVHCHSTTGTTLNVAVEEGNCIHAVQARADGSMYATAGTDRVIRVYDETTRRPFLKLKDGDGTYTTGHSNNIYSIAWKAEDFQVLVTGGWDRTVQIWDMRVGKSVRSIYGPYVCGDSVDVLGQEILTGSWRHTDPLQLWDYGGAGLLTNVPFPQPEPDATLLYAAKFARQSNMLYAGGSGKQPLMRLYHKDGRAITAIKAPSAVHALDMGMARNEQPVMNICCAFHILSFSDVALIQSGVP